MDRSQSDLTDFCYGKDAEKKIFLGYAETLSLLYDKILAERLRQWQGKKELDKHFPNTDLVPVQ